MNFNLLAAREIIDNTVAPDVLPIVVIKRNSNAKIKLKKRKKIKQKEKEKAVVQDIQKQKKLIQNQMEELNQQRQNWIIFNNLPIFDKKRLAYQMKIYDFMIKSANICFQIQNQNINRLAFKKISYKQPSQDDIKYQDGFLYFDSNFENGNLYEAYKVGDFEYNLMLLGDINSLGQQNLNLVINFGFILALQMENQIKSINLIQQIWQIQYQQKKSKCLFQNKMSVCVFSENQQKWIKNTQNIQYTQNKHFKEFNYTLSFEYKFEQRNDRVYFATNFPYRYKDLIRYLNKYKNKIKNEPFIQCHQMELNKIDKAINFMIIINKKQQFDKKFDYRTVNTNNNFQSLLEQIENKKKIILILCRQHPAETVGNYILEGIMNNIDQQILEKTIFIIIPMINIDGVIFGNFRCCQFGVDPNRLWNQDLKYDSILNIKQAINSIKNSRHKLELVLELQGSSSKLNVFAQQLYKQKKHQNFKLLNLLNDLSIYFRKENCTYIKDQNCNELKSYIYNQFPYNLKIMTIECSYFGYENYNQLKQFEIQDFKDIGRDIFQAIKFNLQNSKKKDDFQDLEQNNLQENDEFQQEDHHDINHNIIQKQKNETNDQQNQDVVENNVIKLIHKIKQKNQLEQIEQNNLKQQQNNIQQQKNNFKQQQNNIQQQQNNIQQQNIKIDNEDLDEQNSIEQDKSMLSDIDNYVESRSESMQSIFENPVINQEILKLAQNFNENDEQKQNISSSSSSKSLSEKSSAKSVQQKLQVQIVQQQQQMRKTTFSKQKQIQIFTENNQQKKNNIQKQIQSVDKKEIKLIGIQESSVQKEQSIRQFKHLNFDKKQSVYEYISGFGKERSQSVHKQENQFMISNDGQSNNGIRKLSVHLYQPQPVMNVVKQESDRYNLKQQYLYMDKQQKQVEKIQQFSELKQKSKSDYINDIQPSRQMAILQLTSGKINQPNKIQNSQLTSIIYRSKNQIEQTGNQLDKTQLQNQQDGFYSFKTLKQIM